MQLNINLLEDLPIAKATQKYLSAPFLRLVFVYFIGALLLIHFLNLALYYNAKSNMGKLTATLTTYVDNYSQLQKQIDDLQFPEAIEVTKDMTITNQLTPYLQKLASYTPHGIWLTNLNLNQKSEIFSITGQSIKTSFILELIKNIAQYNIFNGQALSNIKIQQDPKIKTVSFTISNQGNKT